jgi:predicted nucleotidyltransferase
MQTVTARWLWSAPLQSGKMALSLDDPTSVPVGMRLSPEQIATIKQTAHALLGDGARVFLFGSRVDDAKKGGDIDLLLETDRPVVNRATTLGALYVALIRQLGDRKIDILLKDSTTRPAPVLDIARQSGIQL